MKRRKTARREKKRLFELRKRRRKAARLFKKEVKQADIARILNVSRQSVSQWHKQWRRGGEKALKGSERLGRRPRLSSTQLKRLDQELRMGARAHGFSTDLWTLKRVASVVEAITGVHYHQGHTWKILGKMGWSLQRPAKRAKERNEQAIRNWVAKKWPELKKKP
ncbi:MAG: transposase [Planctomycetes bacterium]|nr:transposase [Planctomycetota bacterium]